MQVQVNEPHIVHETIDGETILMDLRSGNYFSIEKSGAVLWEILVQTGDVGDLLQKAGELSQPDSTDQVKIDIQKFVNKLIEESLVKEAEGSETSEMTGDQLNSLKKVLSTMEPLEVNKYSDMQDMLLLDPIHDVDEKGWPEPKKDNDKDKE
jgi:hypothetical protein